MIYQQALKYLARREHSAQEIKQKLKLKFDLKSNQDLDQNIDQIIILLQQKNLLNDARFAECYARMRANRGYGKLRIQAELKKKGISEEIVAGLTWKNNADFIRQVREKKFGHYLPVDIKEKARQIRYLYYKGFCMDDIYKVFKFLKSEDE